MDERIDSPLDRNSDPAALTFWRLVFFVSAAAVTALFFTFGGPDLAAGRFATSLRWRLGGIVLLVAAAGCLGLLVVTFTHAWARIRSRMEQGLQGLRKLNWVNLLFILAAAALLIAVLFYPLPQRLHLPELFNPLTARLAVLWLCGLAGAIGLAALFPSLKREEALLGALVGLGIIYRAAAFGPDVSSFPFTLGWSEASRFYYGSLFFSQSLYGVYQPWPFLHPSRYLLLSIPFLIQSFPLWVHRLWQVLLWLGLAGTSAWFLVRRLQINRTAVRWLAWGWAFLFLFQGPVYYHLQICVFIVLAFFDKRHFTRSLIAVIFASVWAGISRVNWFPVPAVLAIALYVLETPYSQTRSFWRYFFQPAVFAAAGLVSALAAQFIYIQLSGQPDQASFGSSFTADLLWNRLLPSSTYGPGILPMTLLLSLPVLILLIANLRGQRLHFWRLAALFAMTALLFGGGLVVSTKIGGGSNLHNLDSYLVLLAVWSSYLLAGRIETESSPSQFWKPAWLLAAIVILPLVPNMMSGQAYPQYDFGSAQAELNTLRQQVEKVSQAGGRVLFIAERQLVTFHQVNVPMQPGFETLELMEWAISNNQPMLGTFYESLHRHDYALIVAQSQRTELKDAENGFPEENNAWVAKITLPLLKEYQPILTLPKSDIQIFAPIP